MSKMTLLFIRGSNPRPGAVSPSLHIDLRDTEKEITSTHRNPQWVPTLHTLQAFVGAMHSTPCNLQVKHTAHPVGFWVPPPLPLLLLRRLTVRAGHYPATHI